MKTVKEMALEYYPKLWDINRLKSLVKASKLSSEDFKEITGEQVMEINDVKYDEVEPEA